MKPPARDDPPDLALYYPSPLLADPDWLKNLILFFDGVAFLGGRRTDENLFQRSPWLIKGLEEEGLLNMLRPEETIDEALSKKLVSQLIDVLDAGLLDDLKQTREEFQIFSLRKLGTGEAKELAQLVLDELEDRRLLRPATESSNYVLIHPTLESLILTLLTELIRAKAGDKGYLWPVTDHPEIQNDLGALLRLPPLAGLGPVITSDLMTVGVNVSHVPLKELMRFRADNFPLFADYSKDLRLFVRQLSTMDEQDRTAEFAARQRELRERARKLEKLSRRTWGEKGVLAVRVVGSQVSPRLAKLVEDLSRPDQSKTRPFQVEGPFSYLFRAKGHF